VSPPPAFAQGVAPTRAFVVVAGPGVARYEGADSTFNIGVGGEVVWSRGLCRCWFHRSHLAAGLDQTLGNRLGLRHEVRDHVFPDVHVSEFVVGFV